MKTHTCDSIRILLFVFFMASTFLRVDCQINFDMEKDVSFPFWSECQHPSCDTIQGSPAGWGVMSPAVVVEGEDQYAFAMYGCDQTQNDRWRIQCVEIVKNGEPISETLSFRTMTEGSLVPAGTHRNEINQAYQPPLLFKHRNKLILIHWAYMTARGINIIYAHSVDLRLQPPLQWKYERSHIYVDNTTFNYLGGALKGDDIYIAGWRAGGALNYNRSELINMHFANDTWVFTGPQTIAAYDGNNGFEVLYPHVLVLDNDEIRVLGTFHDSRKESEFNSCVEGLRYHNIAEWKGRWRQSQPYQAVWSDRADLDPCSYGGNEQLRFVYDYLCVGCGDGNPGNDDIYAVYQHRDVTSFCPKTLENRFPIRKNGVVILNDVGEKFTGGASNSQVYFMSMTHLSSGQFVFATTIGNDINLQVSSNLIDFLPKSVVKRTIFNNDVEIGTGNQIKLGQSNKNGSDRRIDKLHLYHSGRIDFRNDNDDLINNNHRYKFYKAFVNN
ncbi:MAG: hypothetical protein AAGA77_13365 [Bacteroidota bacterium]